MQIGALVEDLLNLLEGYQVNINAGTLDGHGEFEQLPSLPVVFALILFELIASPIVDKPDFFSPNE